MKPIVYPRGRWTANLKRPWLPSETELIEAPLRELFWSPPETTLVEEAAQRIANALVSAASLPEPIQLFDDLYQAAAG